MSVSDNTAANLLVRLLGGSPAVTAFARSFGDTVTRIDRLEPDLNVTAPGDPRGYVHVGTDGVEHPHAGTR